MKIIPILVAYDVCTETSEGRKRLRKVANICLAYGQRVQKSVFECSLTDVQLEQFKIALMKCVNQHQDSLRVYRLFAQKDRALWTYGLQQDVDYFGPLIV